MYSFPNLPSEMYHREVAGGGRESTSNEIYCLVASSEMVSSQTQGRALSAAAVQASWQPQLSTVVNVKVVHPKSPPAKCSSVGRTSVPEVGSDVHYRTEAAPCVQSISQSQLLDLTGRGSYLLGQPASVTPHYHSAVGQPVLAVQPSSDTRASLQQMMVNRRAVQEGVLPRTSDRESVLLQFTEELQQQKRRTRHMHSCAGSPRQSVVKPVPVKVQPGSMPRFHPLMSSPSHMTSTTVVPSAAQIASQQSASNTSNEANLSARMRSPGLSHPSLLNTPMSHSGSTTSYHPYPASMNQSMSVSQSVQFSGLDQPWTGRWCPASDASVDASFFSPTRSASGVTSVVQEDPDLTRFTAHFSPVGSCQSQNYSSHQHRVISPHNYGPALCRLTPETQMRSPESHSVRLASPRQMSPKQSFAVSLSEKLASPVRSSQQGLPTPQTQMRSPELQSAILISPRHLSPQLHTAVTSAELVPTIYTSQLGVCVPNSYNIQSHDSVSGMQLTGASSQSLMPLDLHHGLGSQAASRSSHDVMAAESLKQHAVSCLSKLISPTQVMGQ